VLAGGCGGNVADPSLHGVPVQGFPSRRNMMSGSWRALGTGYGYAAGSPYQNYWTQDFGGASDSSEPPLVDGSHLLVGSEVVFLANWADAAAPRSISVVVDGAATTLTLDLRGATRTPRKARAPVEPAQ
jgi:hypothetical protein